MTKEEIGSARLLCARTTPYAFDPANIHFSQEARTLLPKALDALEAANREIEQSEARTELWKSETGKLQVAIRAYADALTTESWRELCRLVGMPFDVAHTPGGMILTESESMEIYGLTSDLRKISSLIARGEKPGMYRAAGIDRLVELLDLVPCAGSKAVGESTT